MKKFPFNCTVITPMFIAGHDQKKAELRAPSIKGQLRYWWRALYGTSDVAGMKKREGEIFGSTEKNGTRSRVLLRVKPIDIKVVPIGTAFEKTVKTAISATKPQPVYLVDYLALGVASWDRDAKKVKTTRDCLEPGSTFIVELRIKNDYREEVLNAFRMMVVFGGLGSKSRNGYGSFSASAVDEECTVAGCLKSLKEKNKRTACEFLSVSKDTRLYKTKVGYPTWEQCLGNLGLIYRVARGKLEVHYQYSRRQYLAAPLMGSSRPGERPSEQSIVGKAGGRKSKPFFLTVRPENKTYRGYLLYVGSSRYYPEGLRGISEDDYQKVITDFKKAIKDQMEEVPL